MRYNKKNKPNKGKFIWVNGNKVYLEPSRKIPTMKYYDYITSAYWKARRLRYFHFNKRQCAICNSTQTIQLHHLCYNPKEYGREPDNDFVALCREHHAMFHQVHGGVPPQMKTKTLEFVQTMRQMHNSNINDLSWI